MEKPAAPVEAPAPETKEKEKSDPKPEGQLTTGDKPAAPENQAASKNKKKKKKKPAGAAKNDAENSTAGEKLIVRGIGSPPSFLIFLRSVQKEHLSLRKEKLQQSNLHLLPLLRCLPMSTSSNTCVNSKTGRKVPLPG
jgi:hypothetical protein